MRASAISKLHPQQSAHETALAKLGYKQKLYREFSPLEVSLMSDSFVYVIQPNSCTVSVLFYAIPNGGPFAVVFWWANSCPFIMCIGLAMAALASAAPTSGGLYYWTYPLAAPRCRNFLLWLVGFSSDCVGLDFVNWTCATQITAAIRIASSDLSYATTNKQLYGIYAALVLSNAVLVSFGTKVLARLQRLHVGTPKPFGVKR
ncbi:hypothetical protein DEU56DRAFT_745707 [Suillus clintonianus]|uniref:uncharacterized protein n=1 Tax=Suillus clintonianus TaxID=1904413 RepID=UPI001B8862E9|nr:uncharacterized protein DEU56DRAFT_745707 [Suillus clintonianus]KAG2122934.1 hypothetical protein DEU56DRAFT_745707 [Suillus clintonianus]